MQRDINFVCSSGILRHSNNPQFAILTDQNNDEDQR